MKAKPKRQEIVHHAGAARSAAAALSMPALAAQAGDDAARLPHTPGGAGLGGKRHDRKARSMKEPSRRAIQDPSRMKPTAKPSPEPRIIEIRHQAHEMGGSKWKEFNDVLIKQVIGSLPHDADEEGEAELVDAAAAALAGIRPKDEVEGMLAARWRRTLRRWSAIGARCSKTRRSRAATKV